MKIETPVDFTVEGGYDRLSLVKDLETAVTGIPDFRIADVIRDGRILNDAKEDAFAFVDKDPYLVFIRKR